MDIHVNYDGCDVCGDEHATQECPELSVSATTADPVSRARLTLPHNVELVAKEEDGAMSVVARATIENKTRLGPFESPRHSTTDCDEPNNLFCLKVFSRREPALLLDTSDEFCCNWLFFIDTARTREEQNLMAVQMGSEIYFVATRTIAVGEEMRVWYAPHYAKKMGKSDAPDGLTITASGRDAKKKRDVSQSSPLHTGVEQRYLEKSRDTATPMRKPHDSDSQSDFPVTHESTRKVWRDLLSPRGLRISHPMTATGPRSCRRCTYTAANVRELALHMKDHLKNFSREKRRATGEKKARKLVKFYGEKRKRTKSLDTLRKLARINKGSEWGLESDDVKESLISPSQWSQIKSQNEEMSTAASSRNNTQAAGEVQQVEAAENNTGSKCTAKLESVTPTRVSAERQSGPVTPTRVSLQRQSGPITPARVSAASHSEPVTPTRVSAASQSEPVTPTRVSAANQSEPVTPTRVSAANQSEPVTPTRVSAASQSVPVTPTRVSARIRSGKVNIKKVAELFEPNAGGDDCGVKKMRKSNNAAAPPPGALASSAHATAASPHVRSTSPHVPSTSPHVLASSAHATATSPHVPSTSPHLIATSPQVIGTSSHEIATPPHISASSLNFSTPSPRRASSPEERVSPASARDGPHGVTSAHASSTVVIIKQEVKSEPTNKDPELFKVKTDDTGGKCEESDIGDGCDKIPSVIWHVNDVSVPEKRENVSEVKAEVQNGDSEQVKNEEPGRGGVPVGGGTGAQVVQLSEDLLQLATAADDVTHIQLSLFNGSEVQLSVQQLKQLLARGSEVSLQFDTSGMSSDCENNGSDCENNSSDDKLTNMTRDINITKTEVKASASVEAEWQLEDNACELLGHEGQGHGDSQPPSATATEQDSQGTASKPRGRKGRVTTGRTQKTTRQKERQETSGDLLSAIPDEVLRKMFTVEDFSAAESDDENSDYNAKIEVQQYMDGRLEGVRAGSGVFMCGMCGRRLSSKWRLAKHMCHHPATSCPACKKCYTSRESMKSHECVGQINTKEVILQLKHGIEHCVKVDEQTALYQCQACERSFDGVTSLLRHVVIHDGVFVCEECGRCFDSKSRFNTHILKCAGKKQTEDLRFVCELCGRLFERQSHLKRHLEGHQAVYSCDKCDRKFIHSSTFRAHICDVGDAGDNREVKGSSTSKCENEDTTESHCCEFCGQNFKTQRLLVAHLSSHTDEYHCQKCGRHYARRESWLPHVAVCDPPALAARGIQVLPCKDCDKVFTKESALLNHEKSHVAALRCARCEQAFSTRQARDAHECQGAPPQRYECAECGRSFKRRQFLERHLPLHTGEFTCVICSKAFERKESLIKHMLLCTASVQVSTSGAIKCTFCGEEFTEPRLFLKHYTAHTHPFQCHTCQQRFMRRINLDKHTCRGGSKQAWECSECGKTFRSSTYLDRHMHVHSGKLWHCERCGRDFKRPDMWKIHMCTDKTGKRVKIHRKRGGASVREEHVSTVCTVCGHAFHNVSNLNKHMLRHFEKKEHCPFCQKKFHEKAGLKAHIENVHGTGEKKWRCKECGKFMKCRNSLYAHRKTFHSHTQVVYECNECGKQLKSKAYLLKHIESAHAKTQKHVCQICQRVFKTLEQLERHASWHEQGQMYLCDFCDASYVMQSDVMRHMRRNHAGHVFVCEFCNQHFKQPFTIRSHLEKYHSQQWSQLSDRKKYIRQQVTVIKEYAERELEWAGTEADWTGKEAEWAGTDLVHDHVNDSIESDRVIVAKVQIPAASGPPPGPTQSTSNISEQVLSALKQITNPNGSGGSKADDTVPSVITIEGSNGQEIPVALPGGLADGQGFILLPAESCTVSGMAPQPRPGSSVPQKAEPNFAPVSVEVRRDEPTFMITENGQERVISLEELERLTSNEGLTGATM